MPKKGLVKHIILLLCALALAAASQPALADLAPKESLHVRFRNVGDEPCYAALFSDFRSVPALGGNETQVYFGSYGGDAQDPIREAFESYQDPDGYFFAERAWDLQKVSELYWGYFPPNAFRVVLYYPERNAFAQSNLCERFAFDSYFTADLGGGFASMPQAGAALEEGRSEPAVARVEVRASHYYGWKLFRLFLRVAVTLGIELLVALLFGYRKRDQVRLIALVNVATQLMLNALLNGLGTQVGAGAYLCLELLVFAIEAAIYVFRLSGASDAKSRWLSVVYALTANALSFLAGLVLAAVLPSVI